MRGDRLIGYCKIAIGILVNGRVWGINGDTGRIVYKVNWCGMSLLSEPA